MKVPKEVKRLCPHCKKHTTHKVSLAKNKTMFSVHPMSHGGSVRQHAKHRGKGIGMGNCGRFSRPPVKSRKMMGKKLTKKTDFRYTCQVCKKTQTQSYGIRAKKVELV